MLDQLKIGIKSSYDDFEASVKSRSIGKPAKKTIKETVPFSNTTYDFTAINGEIYWEERELEYVFEIIADSAEELEKKKAAFAAWVMNIMSADLYDPFIKDYHFKATFSSISEDDSEIEKSTITVKFTAYPYMIANTPKIYTISLEAGVEKTVAILNESSHRLTPTITTTVAVTVKKDGVAYGLGVGKTMDETFMLAAGTNTVRITSEEDGSISFSFYEEVF